MVGKILTIQHPLVKFVTSTVKVLCYTVPEMCNNYIVITLRNIKGAGITLTNNKSVIYN